MSKASRLPRSTREDRDLARIVAHRPFRRMLAHQGIDPTQGRKGLRGDDLPCHAKVLGLRRSGGLPLWLTENHRAAHTPSFCANGATFEACRIYPRSACVAADTYSIMGVPPIANRIIVAVGGQRAPLKRRDIKAEFSPSLISSWANFCNGALFLDGRAAMSTWNCAG